LFDHASLTIFQRNDRTYKTDLLEMNPHVDYHITASPQFKGITIDSFQEPTDIVANGEPIPDYIFQEKYWKHRNTNKPKLILHPGNMPETELSTFLEPAFLKVPDKKVPVLDEALIGHGVDPNKWFCVIN
jgi:hypothetical protein